MGLDKLTSARAPVGWGRKNARLDSVVFIPTLCLSSQVIVEKAPKARVPDLDKRKYLVPSDLTGNALPSLDHPPPPKHFQSFLYA